jgi:hypothetical protein
MGRCGNYIGCILGIAWQKILDGFMKCADNVRSGQRGAMKRGVMVEHAACQHGFGGLFNPLVNQGTDFSAEIGCDIQVGQLEAL